MSTFDQLVNECQQVLSGYGLSQARAAFLQNGIDSNDLSISVGDATGFEQGIAEIGNELVFIDSVDYGSAVLTLSPDGRGWYGSTAEAHDSGARITMAPVFPRQQIAQTINESIIATYPTLFGVGTTSFSFNISVTTYEIPAEAEKILRVTTGTHGFSGEQPQLRRWSFNTMAPTGTYASGKSITLEEAAVPGRDVTVTYLKQPTEITFGDDFTESGLSETAKLCVKYATCSTLTAFMDTSRLPVDTAQADEYDPSRNGIGTASRISAQLYQRYLLELDNERKRLRSAYPANIVVRTR